MSFDMDIYRVFEREWAIGGVCVPACDCEGELEGTKKPYSKRESRLFVSEVTKMLMEGRKLVNFSLGRV